jgi:hypothetical protein
MEQDRVVEKELGSAFEDIRGSIPGEVLVEQV